MGLQELSILLEVCVAVLFILAARGKGTRSPYTYLAVTFGIYVWYDLARLLSWQVSASTTQIAFFIATISALYAAWRIYKH